MKARFFYSSEIFMNIWKEYGVVFSQKFCAYFADNVDRIMLIECNLKASSKIGLSLFKQNNDKPMYEPGIISKLNIAISILPEFRDNIRFCWKSKSGKVITIINDEFEINDLECWIEGLKPKLYWEQAYSKKIAHPFLINNLPYELEVYDYGTDMSIFIQLSDIENISSIAEAITNSIENYNKKSSANNRANGVIHNSSYEFIGDTIHYRIDSGSAGIGFIKVILRLLAKFSTVKKVALDL